ncbi:ABC transporter transmembrane domain-containing protein [Achromobacter xylosoxidans]
MPLGWFTQRASGEVKQVLQDDIATLHSLTAHFYTAVGRAAGAIVASAVYLFAMDWRMAIVALLPFPGFFLFLRRAMKASGAHMQEFVERLVASTAPRSSSSTAYPWSRPSATLAARMAATAKRSTASPAPSPPSRARWWAPWPMPTR